MEGKELNKVLKARAIEHGLCDKWQDEWDMHSTRQELIDKFLSGIHFCIEHDYPRLEFVKAHFPTPQLHENGIYVDEAFECGGAERSKTIVAMGKSNGRLRLTGYGTWSVYVLHESCADIQATGGARVFVECWGDSRLSIYADEESKAFVYWHGGSINADGNVIVRDKRNENVNKS